MSEGLKELKEIELKWKYGVFTFVPNFEIIEKELKRLEEYDNGANVCIHINRYNELCDKEEVLEIIENKEVNMTAIKVVDTVEKYNRNLLNVFTRTSAKKRYLTETEFNKIKSIVD